MILGEMTDMPEHACLNCGSINDALSAIAEEKGQAITRRRHHLHQVRTPDDFR